MILTEKDLAIINSVSERKFISIGEIIKLSKAEVLNLTDLLGGLIGYDSVKKDIDDIGIDADNVISKLLILLEKRGEM